MTTWQIYNTENVSISFIFKFPDSFKRCNKPQIFSLDLSRKQFDVFRILYLAINSKLPQIVSPVYVIKKSYVRPYFITIFICIFQYVFENLAGSVSNAQR